MKAYVYETFEQLGRIPANIVIPVGNGTLFIGAVKALEHLHASGAIERFPNIIALQSEKCDPLYRAREAGLEPLANMIIMQASPKGGGAAIEAAAAYINEEAGIDTAEKALAGASDIVAEIVAEDPENVAALRAFTQNTADIVVEATDPTE